MVNTRSLFSRLFSTVPGILPGLLLVSAVLFGSLPGNVHAANITASTSRNPVALDDSFHLVYEADSSVDDDPDFSPIYKDFDILNSSQSTNMRSVNGSWSLKKSWDLTLIAKATGKFVIPQIAFGKDISPSIQVTVLNSSSANSGSGAPGNTASVPAKIFLESSIDKKTGYVQSQFIYTIRLLRTVTLTGASLSEPTSTDADAIIQLIGEDNYQTRRNGISYEVFERRYAVFPQKSGKLKINPLTFDGRVNAAQPRSIFDQFRMSGQLKRLRSKAVEFTVKPAPANIRLQDWLPASELQLVDEWSDDIQNITAGEPVTRTITIAAKGLTSVQLPELKFEDIKGLKQYPDKAVVEDRSEGDDIIGLKQVKVALIPVNAGSYQLPEITLNWWNTKTDQAETATIPARQITVAAAADDNTGDAINTAATPAQSQPEQAPVNTLPNTSGNSSTAINQQGEPLWMWLSAFLGCAWLVTLALLFKKRGAVVTEGKAGRPQMAVKLSAAIKEVEKQARNKDADATRRALIEWAKANFADSAISNLSMVEARCSARLSSEVERLNQSLYNPQQPDWDNTALLQAFKEETSSTDGSQADQAHTLKPLYGR